MSNIIVNYQQIYEEEIPNLIKDSLGLSNRFYDLSNNGRQLVEELIDAGSRSAIASALDPETLGITSDLAGEMSDQLKRLQTALDVYLSGQNLDVGTYL